METPYLSHLGIIKFLDDDRNFYHGARGAARAQPISHGDRVTATITTQQPLRKRGRLEGRSGSSYLSTVFSPYIAANERLPCVQVGRLKQHVVIVELPFQGAFYWKHPKCFCSRTLPSNDMKIMDFPMILNEHISESNQISATNQNKSLLHSIGYFNVNDGETCPEKEKKLSETLSAIF